ncbi:MAG: DUF1761 domain-containing protein [Phyllobacteriaceae bacterium]|nr:DUF1761 domain-containing protein [Phyllobacteriaceae bacterium]
MKHNHIAIWILVVAHMALGILWYSPFLFLDPWAAGFRLDVATMAEPNPMAFVFVIGGAALSGYVASWLIGKLGVTDMAGATKLALILWAGPVFAALAPHYLFGQIGLGALAIDLANTLFGMLMTTIVLTLWRAKS